MCRNYVFIALYKLLDLKYFRTKSRNRTRVEDRPFTYRINEEQFLHHPIIDPLQCIDIMKHIIQVGGSNRATKTISLSVLRSSVHVAPAYFNANPFCGGVTAARIISSLSTFTSVAACLNMPGAHPVLRLL